VQSTKTPAQLFDMIVELGPLIREHQREADQLGRISDTVMAGFFDRDLFRILLPADLGGAGIDLATGMRLVEEVAYYDGSMGWVFEIGIGGIVRAGFLPRDQARALLLRPDVFVTGTFPPLGRATIVDGGFLVSGRWGFASGIHHATWIVAGCVVHEGNEPLITEQGAPVIRHVFVPRQAATLPDTWHVGGMRATGSTEYTLDNVFVPAAQTTSPLLRERFHPAPIFKVLDPTLGVGFAFVALGIARATIDGVVALAASQVGEHADGSTLRDRPSAHYQVAKAQAMIESARLYLIDALEQLGQWALQDEPLPMSLRARIRRAQVHAAETAATIVDDMYRTAGSAALFEDAPFERSLRDVHAVIAQIWLQRAAMEDAGRVAFGLLPRQRGF
jgi:indole-3-acetate monooxygenase